MLENIGKGLKYGSENSDKYIPKSKPVSTLYMFMSYIYTDMCIDFYGVMLIFLSKLWFSFQANVNLLLQLHLSVFFMSQFDKCFSMLL